MNHRTRDDRDFDQQRRQAYGQGGDWQERERHEREHHRRFGGRSDRDIQSDYSGGGYDQVGGSQGFRGGRSEWRGGGSEPRGGGYGREGSYPQSRSLEDSGSEYGSEGRGYGGAGYGYGASGAGGVGYGAPGYGAGESYGAAGRYRGDFQRDRDWLRGQQGQGAGYDDERGFDARYGSGYGAFAGEGRHSQESYGQYRGARAQDWYARGSAGQGYGGRGYAGDREERSSGYGYGADSGLQGDLSGRQGRSYRGVGPRNYTRSDERIREDLNERLTDAHDIDASGLSVEVNNGVATLNGTVSERWMKHRAEDIAEGCSGVRDVRNMIQVTSSGRSQGLGEGSHAGSSGGSGYAQGGSGSGTGSATSQGSASSQGSHAGSGSTGSSLGAGASQYGSGGSSGGSTGSGTQSGSTGGSAGSTRGPNV